MKKLKYLGFILIIFLINIIDTYAVDIKLCTSEEMNRLKELANNVKFQVDYKINTTEGKKNIDLEYLVKIVNFDPDLKISFKINDEADSIELKSTDEIPTIFGEGEKINFKVYAYTANLCTGELLKTVTVNFPTYNDYYYFNKEKCQANPDFKYCKEFMDTNEMNFADIDKEFAEYLKEDDTISSTSNLKWYLIGGGIVVFVIGIVIIVIIKNKRNEYDDI